MAAKSDSQVYGVSVSLQRMNPIAVLSLTYDTLLISNFFGLDIWCILLAKSRNSKGKSKYNFDIHSLLPLSFYCLSIVKSFNMRQISFQHTMSIVSKCVLYL